MKRLIGIGLIGNAILFAVLIGLLSKGRIEVVHAAGGGETPKGNGDVNGDGSIDLSDAVYLLSSLFLGGKDPVTIVCTPAGGNGFPASGQTTCFDANGTEIDCGRADYLGQDGFYQAGCVSDGRFDDHGDGTVTDTCTGLMWQQQTVPEVYNWQNGLKYCENLNLAGYEDWRLPNVRELISILDYGRLNPCIDPVFGIPDPSHFYWYWSSSTAQDDPSLAWIVGFWVGLTKGWYKTDAYHIRAVRNGP